MRPDPIERRFAGSAARLAYFDWLGEQRSLPRPPTVLLVHATGFHGRLWDEVIRALPVSWRVLAVELRGHGRSSKQGPFDRWEYFAQDLVELVDHLALGPIIAAGHSMGGWAVCYTALAKPRAFRHLVLIDPTINSPEFYGSNRFPGMEAAAEHSAARRRNEWADWCALYRRLREREPYSRWQPQVLEDYCRHGLLPDPAGEGYVLACPPTVEASVYFNSWRADLLGRLTGIETPVMLLRAKRRALPPLGETDYAGSPTWEHLATKFRRAEDIYLPEHTHFIPMENPGLVANHIRKAAES